MLDARPQSEPAVDAPADLPSALEPSDMLTNDGAFVSTADTLNVAPLSAEADALPAVPLTLPDEAASNATLADLPFVVPTDEDVAMIARVEDAPLDDLAMSTADIMPPIANADAAAADAPVIVSDAPVSDSEVADEAGQLSRRGRIELLPNEEIVYHLGALYLTNKRVLLYAPNVLRAAFLRDVDAMGTATERLPGGVFVLGLVLLLLSGLTGLLIFFDARNELSLESPLKQALTSVRDFLPIPLEWLMWVVAALAVFFIVSYFLYLSKSLFVSVHGRPVITVSISGYRPRNLDDIDSFINALAAAKDATMTNAMLNEE